MSKNYLLPDFITYGLFASIRGDVLFCILDEVQKMKKKRTQKNDICTTETKGSVFRLCSYTIFNVVYNPYVHLLNNLQFPSERHIFSIHKTRMKKKEKVNDIETCFG